MLIYENQISNFPFTLLENQFPIDVYQHIKMFLEASPTSTFHFKIEDKAPTYNIYLVEQNDAELYTVCHFFSYDQIGKDYLYQNLTLEQIHFLGEFISNLSIV
ncbi:hypothetical protein [Paenibacillus sp. FSL R5-0470]|uniref:hypothetical protein n=1 Tax=Paenibacillus sp. FSL R5-0470 TaxID=2921641 RepID=UPI0030D9CC4E